MPPAFTRKYSAGSCHERPTWASPARWYTASGRASAMAAAMAAPEVTSTSAPEATTSSPASVRWARSHVPTKPDPPVT